MDLFTAWTLAIGICSANFAPFEVFLLSKLVNLPAGAFAGAVIEWDPIGTYELKGDGTTTIIKLFYTDSDSVADKMDRWNGFGVRYYPNSFTIHAVYCKDGGPWQYKRLCSYARCGFLRVAEAKRDSVTIEIKSKLIINLTNADRQFNEELIDRLGKPDSKILTLERGEPQLQ